MITLVMKKEILAAFAAFCGFHPVWLHLQMLPLEFHPLLFSTAIRENNPRELKGREALDFLSYRPALPGGRGVFRSIA